MTKSFRLFHVLAFLFLGSTLCVHNSLAQDATGRIIGNVTDPSGAPIVGAKITVENIGTKITQVVETDQQGFYQDLSLPIGNYRVTVQQPGFRDQVFERQNLQINQSLRLDARLELGQQSDVIEVKDQAANVETQNQTVGATVMLSCSHAR